MVPKRSSKEKRRQLLLLGAICVTALMTAFLLVSHVLQGSSTAGSSSSSRSGSVSSWEVNAPPRDAITAAQVVFVSCNRHDRSQVYWGYIAAAAQCEAVPHRLRAQSLVCRRLYSGKSPLLDTPARRSLWGMSKALALPAADTNTPEESVPVGACGTVVDSTLSSEYRAVAKGRPGLDVVAEGVAKRHQRLFGAASATNSTQRHYPPVDALVWLGDAIYADKPADGKAGQTLGYKEHSIEAVEKMWIAQRVSPAYTAFRQSCVANTESTLPWGKVPAAGAAAAGARVDAGDDFQNKEVGDRNNKNEEDDAEEEDWIGELMAHDTRSTQPLTAGDRPSVFGTWDDHDMGKNDAGKEYAFKKETQKFFLDFLEAAGQDPRWQREGVYSFHTLPFHELFSSDSTDSSLNVVLEALRAAYSNAVCLVLLDARSFRDPANATKAGDMLGEAQWQWLEEQLVLHSQECALTLIGSGVQLSLDEKPAENWAEFPLSRDRLFGMLKAHGIERVAFLTGDVHMGEIGADFTATAVKDVLGYPIIEATSSGLTHSAAVVPGLATLMPLLFPSPRRVGLYVERNFAAAKLAIDAELAFTRQPELSRLLATASDDSVSRALLRAEVNALVNVTFTVFSVVQRGRPVLRLNAPLAMLTRASGDRFIGARVDKVSGGITVLPSAAAVAAAASTSVALLSPQTIRTASGKFVQVVSYPVSSPSPVITATVRILQQYLFPSVNVSAALKQSIILLVVLCIAAGGSVGIVMLNRKRQRSHQQARAVYESLEDPSARRHSKGNSTLGSFLGLRKRKEG